MVLVQGTGGLGPDVATGDAIMVRRKMESLVSSKKTKEQAG